MLSPAGDECCSQYSVHVHFTFVFWLALHEAHFGHEANSVKRPSAEIPKGCDPIPSQRRAS